MIRKLISAEGLSDGLRGGRSLLRHGSRGGRASAGVLHGAGPALHAGFIAFAGPVAAFATAGAACFAHDVNGLCKTGFKAHVVSLLEPKGCCHGSLGAFLVANVILLRTGACSGRGLIRGLLLSCEGERHQRCNNGDDFHVVSLWFGVVIAGGGGPPWDRPDWLVRVRQRKASKSCAVIAGGMGRLEALPQQFVCFA